MPLPNTYFEWSQLLEQFANGDDSVLTDLEQGSFDLDSGSVYRFYNKVRETYAERKKKWIDKFNRLFQIHYIKTEHDLSIVLQNAKSNLQIISRFIELQTFPEDLKSTLEKDLREFVTEARENLKKSFSRDHFKNEKMIIIINNFNLFEKTISKRSSDISPTNSKPDKNQNNKRIIF